MARPLVALCTAFAVALLALPAEAQWKWRDQKGQIQYSDLPPPAGVAEQDILGRPGSAQRRAAAPLPPASAPSAPSLSASNVLAPKVADAELEARLKKAEQEQAAKQKAEQTRLAAARAENCERARSQMRALDSGIRLARVNQKGEREILDDKQREAEVKRTQTAIGADCR